MRREERYWKALCDRFQLRGSPKLVKALGPQEKRKQIIPEEGGSTGKGTKKVLGRGARMVVGSSSQLLL